MIAQSDRPDTFAARAMRALGAGVTVDATRLDAVPRHGPLIVAANHPHGIIDGLALAHLIEQVRPDVRVLTTRLLSPVPRLSELSFYVDPFGGRRGVARSVAGLRAAVRWLEDGHALIVFPAGEVAHRLAHGRPVESPWHTTAARLAARTGATVLPAFIEGRNSHWFYRLGRVHERLRTLLLAPELLRHRGGNVTIHPGVPLHFDRRPLHDEVTATACIHRAVGAAHALEAEIDTLRASWRLIDSGPYEVFCAPASAMPVALTEIGRLREITFRAVGEGTGAAYDLDRFDRHYLHLFLWHRDAREIVGAYRLGLTDRILAAQGVDGLYTRTLFKYDARLLAELPPALELGRSFVRAEYQRSSNALMLLWKGIARFMIESGRYRVLFGPVSISRRYGDLSQQLLRKFLFQNHYHRELGALVTALTPPDETPLPAGIDTRVANSLGELDALIASLEQDGKGIPVLVRQYLRLNAKLLGFNVDPSFGEALDALMMVDLADVEPHILKRYFGRGVDRLIGQAAAQAA